MTAKRKTTRSSKDPKGKTSRPAKSAARKTGRQDGRARRQPGRSSKTAGKTAGKTAATQGEADPAGRGARCAGRHEGRGREGPRRARPDRHHRHDGRRERHVGPAREVDRGPGRAALQGSWLPALRAWKASATATGCWSTCTTSCCTSCCPASASSTRSRSSGRAGARRPDAARRRSMLMRLIAAGTRMPAWVDAGFADYAGRLRGDYRLELVEIALGQRGRGDATKADRVGGLAHAGSGRRALRSWRCRSAAARSRRQQLARWLDERSRDGQPLAFCIGGPDGLAPAVDARARLRWSLSALTLPHGLARGSSPRRPCTARCRLKGQPYHRA